MDNVEGVLRLTVKCEIEGDVSDDQRKLLHQWLDFLLFRNMTEYACTVLLEKSIVTELPIRNWETEA